MTNTLSAADYFAAKLEFTTGPVEVNAMLDRDEEITLIDVRYPDDYAKGHLPGAVNLPKDKWDSFAGLSRDKNNIFYCYSGVCHLAAAAAKHFAEHGYRVMELDGGFDQWQQHKLAVES